MNQEYPGKLILIVGPSGVGKGTIVNELFDRMDNLEYSISATTRPQRTGEIEGKNYFFKTKEEFQTMIANNDLLEWAQFVDNYYGTPKSFILNRLKNNQNIILEIELEGAKQVKKIMPDNTMAFFIEPPSLDILEARLRKRSTEVDDVLQLRIQRATEELTESKALGSDLFDAYIVNEENNIIKSVDRIMSIVNNHENIAKI